MNVCAECKLNGTEKCPGKENCRIEESISNIISDFSMPLVDKYILTPSTEDEAAFLRLKNIKDNIIKFVSEGNNLLIFSNNCGNGKTTWCRKLCTQYVNDIYNILLERHKEFCLSDNILNCPDSSKAFLWNRDKIDRCAMLVNVPDFLYKKKKSISSNDLSADKLMQKMMRTNLLVLDDIFNVNQSSFDSNLLYEIINSRTINKRQLSLLLTHL